MKRMGQDLNRMHLEQAELDEHARWRLASAGALGGGGLTGSRAGWHRAMARMDHTHRDMHHGGVSHGALPGTRRSRRAARR